MRHPSAPASRCEKNRRSNRRPDAKLSLNLTSCIDVVFLLLIFFLVTVNFVQGEGVMPVNFPTCCGSSGVPEPPPANPIVISVKSVGTSGCRLDIEQHAIAPRTFSELSKQLRDMQYNSRAGRNGPFRPDTLVIIRPEPNVRWQHVVNAFNAALSAGYSNVQFGQATEN